MDNSKPYRKPLALVIEDNEAHSKPLAERIERMGADVVVSTCGNDAVDFLIKSRKEHRLIDLIVLDLWLPIEPRGTKVKDLGLLILLRNGVSLGFIPFGCPVIVYTGYASLDNCVECMKAGAYYYFEKGGSGSRERLFEMMEHFLVERHQTELERWATANRAALVEKFCGKILGIFSRAGLESSGYAENIYGEYGAIPFNDQREFGKFMLEDRVLRWEEPFMLDLK